MKIRPMRLLGKASPASILNHVMDIMHNNRWNEVPHLQIIMYVDDHEPTVQTTQIEINIWNQMPHLQYYNYVCRCTNSSTLYYV